MSPACCSVRGRGEQTSVETDGGNLISKTIAYQKSGGAALK